MYLVDNGTGGTVYAWSSTNGAICNSLEWDNMVGITQMPIPTLDIPLLLNFGGAEPSITINFTITSNNNFTGTSAGDWYQLTKGIGWASNQPGWTLYLPEVSTVSGTLSVSVYLYQLQITYSGGTSNTYTGSMVLYVGTLI